MNLFYRRKSVIRNEIDPDEIFLDSENMPGFDVHQFEGRMEKPISVTSIIILSVFCSLVILVLLGKAWTLQVKDGKKYSAVSENNVMSETIVFPERGAIYDRNDIKLAWNKIVLKEKDFSTRLYIEKNGHSHVLGYLKYPSKDKRGFYYREDFEGVAGIEKVYDKNLRGTQGLKIVERDALGNIKSESIIRKSVDGENITLSIDSLVEAKFFEYIKELAERVGFEGGGGAIMDVRTGEIIALTSFPEYDSQTMSDGTDSETIKKFLNDNKKPFLNRVIAGLYTPGSIIKPYIAIAALAEKIIDPETEIISTGSISVQNPYDPEKKSVFMDWKAHGPVDMRKALAVSSNIYFYKIGGGFEDQIGLGVERMKRYFSLFGFGKNSASGFFLGPAGIIPSPAWKERVFPGDPWRIGDTYFTSIGQYGFQVTPLQILRALGSVANGGLLLYPSILKISGENGIMAEKILIDPAYLKIVREGMREGVLNGTASGLNMPFVEVGAKTGTAELGTVKAFVNSWVTGFFPYEDPKYAFVVIMEHGPRANIYGATFVMRELLDWMHVYTSEYLK
ncbi:MAG TPA: penicillin-binding transpeptidase domain-containing protein [Candidatus Paceibacterota bacterium]